MDVDAVVSGRGTAAEDAEKAKATTERNVEVRIAACSIMKVCVKRCIRNKNSSSNE